MVVSLKLDSSETWGLVWGISDFAEPTVQRDLYEVGDTPEDWHINCAQKVQKQPGEDESKKRGLSGEVAARGKMCEKGLRKTRQLPSAVLSPLNLVMGGAGLAPRDEEAGWLVENDCDWERCAPPTWLCSTSTLGKPLLQLWNGLTLGGPC